MIIIPIGEEGREDSGEKKVCLFRSVPYEQANVYIYDDCIIVIIITESLITMCVV